MYCTKISVSCIVDIHCGAHFYDSSYDYPYMCIKVRTIKWENPFGHFLPWKRIRIFVNLKSKMYILIVLNCNKI